MWRYYEGDHPRVWLTKAFKELFEENPEFADAMEENWCDEAIDQPLYRLAVDGFEGETEVHSRAAQNIFDDNNLELDQKDLYRHMRVAGEGFLFVWKIDDEVEREKKPAG